MFWKLLPWQARGLYEHILLLQHGDGYFKPLCVLLRMGLELIVQLLHRDEAHLSHLVGVGVYGTVIGTCKDMVEFVLYQVLV